MQVEFILQNVHFALNIIAALVLFSVCWLYFDAWGVKRQVGIQMLYWVGFLLLSLSFLFHAPSLESVSIQTNLLNSNLIDFSYIFKLLGYLVLTIALLFDPLQKHPAEKPSGFKTFLSGLMPGQLIVFFAAFLSVFTALLYLRRATRGLENHLKGVSYAFFGLATYEVFSLYELYKNTSDTRFITLVEPFGPLWIVTHAVLFVSILALAKWTVGYLLKRLQTQLFMIFLSTTILIFLITTVTFTTLLFNSIQKDHLNALKSDIGVLTYALERVEKQTEADARLIAADNVIVEAMLTSNRPLLRQRSQELLISRGESELTITDRNGTVLMRGHDPERIGDSMQSSPLFSGVQSNEHITTLLSVRSAVVPEVTSFASAPILSDGQMQGAVILGTRIDAAFVESINSQTGLDLSVFSGERRVATTLTDQAGIGLVGTVLTDSRILNKVLVEGEVLAKPISIAGVNYNAAYAPLTDAYGERIGMISVLRKQNDVINAVGDAVQITFVATSLLVILMTIPSFILARKIAGQLK